MYFLPPIILVVHCTEKWPAYAAYISFEIVQEKQHPHQHYIRVIYQDEIQHIFQQSSHTWWRLEDFVDELRARASFSPAAYEKLCTESNGLYGERTQEHHHHSKKCNAEEYQAHYQQLHDLDVHDLLAELLSPSLTSDEE
jgi:hypothetical protein